MYIMLYVRTGVRTETGVVGEQFKKFQLTIRSSWRGGLVVNRPQAFCTLTKAD